MDLAQRQVQDRRVAHGVAERVQGVAGGQADDAHPTQGSGRAPRGALVKEAGELGVDALQRLRLAVQE